MRVNARRTMKHTKRKFWQTYVSKLKNIPSAKSFSKHKRKINGMKSGTMIGMFMKKQNKLKLKEKKSPILNLTIQKNVIKSLQYLS